MRCEDRRQALSLFVDGALDAGDPAGLFAHLESCADCRAFLESLLAMRHELAADRERALREGDELLPARLPVVGSKAERVAVAQPDHRPRWAFAPASAIALAALLLVAGIAIGTRIPRGRTELPVSPPASGVGSPESATPAVVYVYSLAEYPVIAAPPVEPAR